MLCIVSGFDIEVSISTIATVAQVRDLAVREAQRRGLSHSSRNPDEFEVRDAVGYPIDLTLIAASLDSSRRPIRLSLPIGFGG